MSELNRLLSEIVSPECKESKLSVAPVPKSTGFVFARISIVTIAVLMSASGISWTISTVTDLTKASGILEYSGSSLPKPVMASTADFASVASPTTRVNLGDMEFVSPDKLQETEPRSQLVAIPEPKPMLVASITPPATLPSPAIMESSSMEVETVELSNSQLAKLAYRRAQKETQEGDTQRAIKELRKAVYYNPQHVAAFTQLGALLFGRGLVHDAEQALRQGIQENPSSSVLKLTLARIYQQAGREEAALNILTTPQDRLDGEQINVVSMRAVLAQKLGNNELAQMSYRWLTIQEPTEGRWWLGFAVSTERKKALEQALWAYETAISAGGLSNQSVQFARKRIEFIQSQLNKGEVNDGETQKTSG